MSEFSYFSVSYDLLPYDQVIDYDLFVNASSLDDKQKYVKVFKRDEIFTLQDLQDLRGKYLQLYIAESERENYVKSLVRSNKKDDAEKTTVIKDAAVQYLQNIFDESKEFNTEILALTITQCREAVESMIDVVGNYSIESLRALIGNLSLHDFYTFDHSINVSMYCIVILRALKPEATRLELMHAGLGGLLHDLGKIKIKTDILNKPTQLTSEEYGEIKQHPRYGIELLMSGEDFKLASDIDVKTIARIVHEHHENWDGTGYPNRMKEKDIHLLARICTIADFFDAVTTKRSYNQVLPISQAMGVMEKTSGKKIDPKLFSIFANHIKYSKNIGGKELVLDDSFDPTIPYAELPLHEIEEMFNEKDFGKIRILDNNNKRMKK